MSAFPSTRSTVRRYRPKSRRNLMEAAEIATVFVDAGMQVKRLRPQATKLFSLIPTDIGR